MRPGGWAFSDDTHKRAGDPPGFFHGGVFHGSGKAD